MRLPFYSILYLLQREKDRKEGKERKERKEKKERKKQEWTVKMGQTIKIL